MKEASDLGQVNSKTLMCRTDSHVWLWLDDVVTLGSRKRVVEFTRKALCDRCGATREKTVNTTTWEVTKRKIHYGDGYLVKGQGRIMNREVYKEQLRRKGLKV